LDNWSSVIGALLAIVDRKPNKLWNVAIILNLPRISKVLRRAKRGGKKIFMNFLKRKISATFPKKKGWRQAK
jgi:hypothetical protein